MGQYTKKAISVENLIRKLKKLGFSADILVNVQKSLVLSLFIFSAPVLGSASDTVKKAITHHQDAFLTIIDITE